MTTEETLNRWTRPSSDTEQEKQERAERMVRQAIDAHAIFSDVEIKVFGKGSYTNNTNVRDDSDVDIAVRCDDVFYYETAPGVTSTSGSPYTGIWTPEKLRDELTLALSTKFPGQVDASGKVALRITANSGRVDADVVPCFNYGYYTSSTNYISGTRVFRTSGDSIENFPDQQLSNGRAKNNRTNRHYKRAVRILKRTENALVDAGSIDPLPSYFMECLVFNCPDSVLRGSTWTSIFRGVIYHIWTELEGPEPDNDRWFEPNEVKYLFHSSQPWTREQGRDLAQAAWNYWKFS